MKRSSIAALLIALIGTGMVHPIYTAPAPAPAQPTVTLTVPTTSQVVAPAPVILPSGAVATAPVVQSVTTPTLVTVPAPSQSTTAAASTPRVAPAQSPTQSPPAGLVGAGSTPRSAPAQAPAAGTTTQATSPARSPATATAPVRAAASGPTTTTVVPGLIASVAPTPGIPGSQSVVIGGAPAVAPSSSGFYNMTLRASNATGTLNTTQAQQFADGLVRTVKSGTGITTNINVVDQLVGGTSATGRRLQQSTFVLDIVINLGPLSPVQAAQVRALLNGLQVNLGVLVVIQVIIFIPVPVFIPTPAVLPQPPSVPKLSVTVVVTVVTVVNIQGTGSNLPVQGGAQTTNVNNTQVTNVVNNNQQTTTNNIVNNQQTTNNIVNNNQVTISNSGNSVVNNIVNNVQNPATPGSSSASASASASATATAGSATPGTTSTPGPASPATPGGASVATATATASSLAYITTASPVAPAPPVAPSPPPAPPPSCGSQPQCRIYSRDMLCCQNEGILTPFQGAQIEILCTHPVRFAITCLATSGPQNISAASVYNNDYGYNYNFRTNVQWLGQAGGYLGKVGVDVEPARLDVNRPECSLNLQTPCSLDGQIVTTMPAVQPLTFNVIDFTSFYQNYVGFPPTNAIGQFSYSWMNNTYPGGCLEQPTLTVAASFFQGNWPNQPGFAYPCSASATYGALQQTCPNVAAQAQTGVAGIQPSA